jgi:hypothetical protein
MRLACVARAQLCGLALCTLSSILMGFLRGPRLFGTPAAGAHAPANVPLGVALMLLNTVLSAAVQIVNKRTLATFPTVSTTAAVAACAVAFLMRACSTWLALPRLPVPDASRPRGATQRRRWAGRPRLRGGRMAGCWARARTAAWQRPR